MAYTPQTNPGGSTAFRGASADAFGAGIGKGLQQVGGVVEQIGQQQKAADRDAANAAAGLEFARIASEIDKAEIDGRDNAAPGGAGHSEGIAKLSDERINSAIGNIKDPKIRDLYKTRYEDLRGNVTNRAYGWERAAHTTKLVNDVGETTRTLANGQKLNPDAGGLQVSIDAIDTVWDNLDVADDVKEKGKRADKSTIAYAYASAMAEKDPDAILGTDQADSILKPLSAFLDDKQIGQLQNTAQAEKARLDAIARRAASQWEARRRDEIGAIGKRVTTIADDSVTDEELDAARDDAIKMGDKTLELDVANWRDLRDVRKATRDWAPDDWKREIGALEAKGDKLEPGEAMRLTHLRQLRPAAEAKFNDRPEEWANQNGDPMPAIDFENPAPGAGAARAAWSKRIENLGGKPALLVKEEIERFKQRAGVGIAGQIDVAQTIRGVFGVGPDAMAALRQIDGNNPALQIMVGLPAHTAQDYRLGLEAIKRIPSLQNSPIARERFNDYARAIPAPVRGPLWDAARAIAAAELDRAGDNEPDDDQIKEVFDRALNRAAGAQGSGENGGAGGFVRWGKRPLWIPPDMAKGEALRRLSRADATDIIDAHSNATGNGPGGAPYYVGRDGKPVRFGPDAGSLIKNGDLETVAPGVFRVILEDGGYVVNKFGQPWQFNIRKLKAR